MRESYASLVLHLKRLVFSPDEPAPSRVGCFPPCSAASTSPCATQGSRPPPAVEPRVKRTRPVLRLPGNPGTALKKTHHTPARARTASAKQCFPLCRCNSPHPKGFGENRVLPTGEPPCGTPSLLLRYTHTSHLSVVRQADFVAHPCPGQLGFGFSNHADFRNGVDACRAWSGRDARLRFRSPSPTTKAARKAVQ